MPIIDEKRGVLVVRIVYDGAPFSGKTTSLRTLARGLGVDMITPEEHDGRTAFFDWVDYVGGLFEGRQIRCQIVSVPGQPHLAARRLELLACADAVVLVADTRESEMAEALRVLADVVARCQDASPPVGLVLQANKRDAMDAVSCDRLHAELGAVAPLAVVETVATDGRGIREAFVFAVRLALDRVRACVEAGRLLSGTPDIDGPEDLLEALRRLETSAPPETRETTPVDEPGAVVEPAAGDAVPDDSSHSESSPLGSPSAWPIANEQTIVPGDAWREEPECEVPFRPDPMMPGGFIWPPVDGRVMLHEAAQVGVVPSRESKGDWWASCRGLLFHSANDAIFASADLGREALIHWARMHATNHRQLSRGRTVILAEAGGGRFRLWQIVRAHESLRERLAGMVGAEGTTPTQLAEEMVAAGAHLLLGRGLLSGCDVSLACTLWTLSGELRAQPRFVGLMPGPGVGEPPEPEAEELLAREFRHVLSAVLGESRDDSHEVAAALQAISSRHPSDQVARALAELAMGEECKRYAVHTG